MHKNEGVFKPNKLTMITLLFSSMIILMGAAAVAPALKPISEAFPNESVFVISLLVTLPALAVAITGMSVGVLADRFGKARVFIISLIIFSGAGLSGYFFKSFEAILIGRFILGIGIAGIATATTALTADYYTGADRGKIISYQSAAMGIGVLFLETVGGSLADIGWQEPFLVYLIGVPILMMALFSVREPVREVKSNESAPAVKIIHKGRKVVLCYMMIFFGMFFMFIIPTNFPYYVTDMGYNLFICGLMLGILGVSQAVFSLIYARTTNKLTDKNAYAVAFLMIGLAFCLLTMMNMATTAVVMILVGVGMGLITMTVIGSLSIYSHAGGSGKIMGGYSVAMNIGVFCSSLIITPIIAELGSYTVTFSYVGIFALMICAVITVAVLVTRPRAKTERKVIAVESTTEFVSLYDKILIATDGSEVSKFAVTKGLDIARNNVSKVTALYVFDPEYYVNSTGSVLSADEVRSLSMSISKKAFDYVIEEANMRNVEIEVKVDIGHPADAIVSESVNYDLVVCGSTGRTGVSKVLLGSVAQKVAGMAVCPVLICRKSP
ncbi:MAG: MFS transporter [Candidatus Methanomethylophilaceae archaeon]|nr:MFS transporter [Candidatus Methanomethylophilaceae archaeon]MDY0225038.1 MFS transporter [Candidatus Methanomethylophilaceae archaeon]